MLNINFRIVVSGICLLVAQSIFAQSSNLDQKVNQLDKQLGNIQQDMNRLKKLLDNRAILELFQRFDELADELSQLRGEVEQLGHDMTGVKKRQRDLYLDIDRRLGELERSSDQVADKQVKPILIPEVNTLTPLEEEPSPTTAPVNQLLKAEGSGSNIAKQPASNLDKRVSQAVQKLLNSNSNASTAPETNVLTPVPAPATVISKIRKTAKITVSEERQKYQKAFDMLKEGRYKMARTEFKAFLEQFPDGRYSGNAQYWLGEANYVTRQFEQGVKEFKVVLSRYPSSNKVPDAMLKLGYTYYELRQSIQARLVLEDLRKRFPKSTAARLAGKRLERMKKEGL